MRITSATDVAIALAIKAGTITLVEKVDRFGEPVFFIGDEHGLIEVHLTRAEANARLAEIKAAL